MVQFRTLHTTFQILSTMCTQTIISIIHPYAGSFDTNYIICENVLIFSKKEGKKWKYIFFSFFFFSPTRTTFCEGKQGIFWNIPFSTWNLQNELLIQHLSLHFYGTLGSKWADHTYHLAWLCIGTLNLWLLDYLTMVPEESENPWQMVVVTCHQRDWRKNSWYHSIVERDCFILM